MKRKVYTLGLLLAFGAVYGQTASADGIYYVSNNGKNIGTAGNSWGNPHNDLGLVLAEAKRRGVEAKVYVEKGIYSPTTYKDHKVATTIQRNTDKNLSFTIPNNVKVFGGFNIDNNVISEGDRKRYEKGNTTILDGSYKYGPNPTDYINYYHVVTMIAKETGYIDGFTIANGAANGGDSADSFSMNKSFGGGVHVQNGTIILKNCIVRSNFSENRGGALYVEKNGANLFVINSIIYKNISDGDGSAVYANDKGKAFIINSTITDNTSRVNSNGGTLHVKASGNITTLNSILWNNYRNSNVLANISGGSGSDFTVNNNVINANSSTTSLTNSSGLYNFDPKFVDAVNADFRLAKVSEAIDKGINSNYNNIKYGSLLVNDTSKDFDILGKPRAEGNIDLGAVEFSTLGIEDQNVNKSLKVYPNPTTGAFYIEVSQQEVAIVYNITGQLMKSVQLKAGKNQVDISNLQAGYYIIKTNNGSFNLIKK